MLTLTALLRYVLKLPDEIVFGRILPATGLMLFLSTIYYAWLAYRLAKKEGRDTVCTLPSGISVPHMFVVVFAIMLPNLREAPISSALPVRGRMPRHESSMKCSIHGAPRGHVPRRGELKNARDGFFQRFHSGLTSDRSAQFSAFV